MRPVVRYFLGKMLWIEAALLLVPMGVSLGYGEGLWHWMGFLIASLVAAGLGALFQYKASHNDALQARDGMILCSMTWIIFSVIAALPFVISGEYPSFADALVEAISGFTNTGATVITEIESLSHSALFWRALMHLSGGMGVLVFFLAIFPASKNHGTVFLAKAEMSGPSFSKFVARIADVSRILYRIYLAMAAVLAIILMALGMTPFDALCHAMSAAGTGGFSTKNASIASFNSPAIEVTIAVFLFLFAVNFNLYYLILIGRWRQAVRNEELRSMCGIWGLGMLLIYLNTYGLHFTGRNFLNVFFTVISMGSSTGFVTADFELWPLFSKTVLLALMMIGASGGSTGGGLKVSRAMIIRKACAKEIRTMRDPQRILVLKHEGESVDDAQVHAVLVYLAAYLMIIMTAFILIALDPLEGMDVGSSLSVVVSCFSNIGPGFGVLGPTQNLGSLSALSKIVLGFVMLLGRLEIWPILVIFSRRGLKRA